jgi:hypothetical protein
VTVSLRVGEPIETAGVPLGERDALIGRVRDRIAALLAEGRGGEGDLAIG